MGFPKIRGTILGDDDYSILLSILGCPTLGKLQYVLSS